jgi:hypothetical protein
MGQCYIHDYSHAQPDAYEHAVWTAASNPARQPTGEYILVVR